MLVGAAGLTYNSNMFSYSSFSSRVTQADPDTHEVEIDFASELHDGEMRELKVGSGDEDKVLISRIQGKLHCVGNYCTHFGAPMGTGVLFDDKVVCPWHGAAFNVVTGAMESTPALDGLPKFKVTEKDGKFFVEVPTKLPRA